MGQSGSRNCKENMVNPDYLSVITLSDSVVQRLPLDAEDNTPLMREAREQNIDDYWRDRLECIENVFMESLGLSENKFNEMEKRILSMAPPVYKPKCPVNVEEVTRCLSVHSKDPLKCNPSVKKLVQCVDAAAQDEARRSALKAERDKRKKKCVK